MNQLPKMAVPTYSHTLSTNKTITFRPFLVKEEKILLMAANSAKDKEVINAMASIISACVTSNDFDVNELSIFDFQYLFLKIRAKSVSEVCEVNMSCADCGTFTPTNVMLSDVVLPHDTNTPEDMKIMLDDNIGIVFQYPTVGMIRQHKTLDAEEDENVTYDLILDCIKMIYTSDGATYSPRVYSKEEQYEFLENLSNEAFKKIDQFMLKIPNIKHTHEFDCPACGYHNSRSLEGLQDFF